MSTASSAVRPQRLVLYGVSWREYTRMLRAFEQRPGHRLSYDRGTLEIMSPTLEHERDSRLLGRFVIVLTEELALPVFDGGSTTFRRRRLQRGLEPDNCWWIAHEAAVRGKKRVDLKVDPPPDLAVEVDVTHRVVKRMSIYARLRVPEVWQLKQEVLLFHILQPNGLYAVQTHSLAFPQFKPSDLIAHLALQGQYDQNEIVRQFRVFVRNRLANP
jgi:Uma2 family endonuclease